MYRRLIFFGLILSISFQINGQTETDDEYLIQKQHFYDLLYTNPSQAVVYVDSLLATYEKHKNIEKKVKVLLWKGYAHEMLDNYSEALTIYETGIDIATKIQDSLSLGQFLMYKGIVLKEKSRYEDALTYQDKAIRIFKLMKNETLQSYGIGNKGVVYNEVGQYEKSLRCFEKCYEIDHQKGNLRGVSASLNNMANSYYFMGQLNKALEYWERTLAIDSTLGNNIGVSSANRNIGMAYHDLGDYEKCEKYYQLSMRQKKELKQPKSVAKSYNNLGVLYRKQNKYQKSLQMHMNAIRIRDSLSAIRDQAESYHNLGALYLAMGQKKEALEWHHKSLKIRKEIRDSAEIALSLVEMARVKLEIGEVDSAEVHLNSAIAIGERTNYVLLLQKAYHILFKIYRNKEEVEKAKKVLDQLLALRRKDVKINLWVLPEQKKELYLQTLQKDFYLFYDFLHSYSDTYPKLVGEAFNLATEMKGYLLKSSLAMRSRILSSGNEDLIEIYEEWIALKRRISNQYIEGKIDNQVINKSNQLEKLLIKKSSTLGDDILLDNLNWQEVQMKLHDNQVAIEYIQFKDHNGVQQYGAILISKHQKPRYVPLFKSDQLQSLLGDLSGNNYKYIHNLYSDASKSKELYRLIWSPFDDYLVGVKKVFVSPVGLLHKISLASIKSNSGVFLCQEYDLNIKFSMNGINATQKPFLSNINNSLLMGGIHYSADENEGPWDYLKGTYEEIQSIIEILEKQSVKTSLLSGLEATELNFKSQLKESQLVHIATHGFFFPDPNIVEKETEEERIDSITFRTNDRSVEKVSIVKNTDPMVRSGLVLSNANNGITSKKWSEDGLLTALEIIELDMSNTELVVLSACETGLGDIRGSEGVYGLQRAFKMAGVKSLIISLWQVPDKETSEFMIYFYQKLAEGNSIQKAFHQTQQNMSEKYDPYYWGAFTLLE